LSTELVKVSSLLVNDARLIIDFTLQHVNFVMRSADVLMDAPDKRPD